MEREYNDARAVVTSEAGFTLIELMMVVLIIAILIAVLMPTFLGASRRANDRAMQTSLRNSLVAAKAVYVNGASYTLANPATLNAEGVPVQFVDAGTPPTGQNMISVNPVSADYIVFAGQSKSSRCFYIADDASGPGTRYADGAPIAGCPATSAPAAGDAAWKAQW